MQAKWKIFVVTFFSYALIHASRTSWSSLKYTMNSPPYSFSPVFLGTLDMLVLVVLAIALNLFGPKVVSGGPREYLRKGMVALSIVVTSLGLLLYFTVKMEALYALVYPLVGLCSFVGWPACIYVLLT
jgi:sugar phosphate permease